MAKPKRRKSSVRSASKVQEEEFIERARALAEDPSPITPRCEGRCILFCPFKATRAQIARVHAARDDPAKLQRLMGRGTVIARAYAATLTLKHSGKTPHLAQARLPTGTVSYALRGSVPPFNLISIQYHDDQALHLLGAAKFVKSRGLHVYSTPDGLVTTHKRPAAPAAFVEAETERLDLAPAKDGLFTCGHPEAPSALRLRWKSAGVDLRRCPECSGDKNTLHQILEHYAGPDAAEDFDPRIDLPPAPGAPEATPAPADVRAYLKGAIGDAELVERTQATRARALRATGRAFFMIGTRSYGDDARAFIDALAPSPLERRALEAALAGLQRPVLLDRASPIRALRDLWPDRGLEALTALTGDAEAARKLYRPDESTDALADLLQRAATAGDRRRLEAQLPRYRDLPAAVAFADEVARLHRVRGRDETLRHLTNHQSPDPKARAVALAGLHVLGASSGKEWKYGRVEQDLADFLREPLQTLLEGAPGSYGQALEDLARRAGYTDPLKQDA